MSVLAAPAFNLGVPAVVSVLLHIMLVVVMTVNWTSRSDVRAAPRIVPRHIEAKLITAESLAPKKKKKAETKVPTTTATARPRAQTRPRPAAVVTARPKPEAESKPLTKPKELPKPEPKVTEAPGPSQRELAVLAQQELALALDAEDDVFEEASDEQLALSFVALIARTVEDNWSRPPSARNDMEAELILQLIPTGEVVSVSVSRSSGQQAFDRSAVNAVQKAERFPELQQLPPRVFEKNFRRLRLKFKPEDLRY